jgi:hypothetical protein
MQHNIFTYTIPAHDTKKKGLRAQYNTELSIPFLKLTFVVDYTGGRGRTGTPEGTRF